MYNNKEFLRFDNLDCWKLGREFKQIIIKSEKSWPKFESNDLRRQLNRAVCSITANIAEGYGRFSYKENIQFCRIARGSLYESLDHLISALDLGYINESEFNLLKLKYINCERSINGYIKYLSTQKNTT